MSVLQLSDYKQWAGISGTGDDAEIQRSIDAAEASITRKCGPLSPTAYTRRLRGGAGALFVPLTPLLSVVSIYPVGVTPVTAFDLTTVSVDPAGAVSLPSAGGIFTADWYDVAFIAGRTTAPADLMQGVLEHAKHLYETRQGDVRDPRAGSQAAVPGSAYVFTWRVNELIAPHMQGGFA